jgi:hypothetical protein
LPCLKTPEWSPPLTHSAFKNHGRRQMNRFQKRPN